MLNPLKQLFGTRTSILEPPAYPLTGDSLPADTNKTHFIILHTLLQVVQEYFSKVKQTIHTRYPDYQGTANTITCSNGTVTLCVTMYFDTSGNKEHLNLSIDDNWQLHLGVEAEQLNDNNEMEYVRQHREQLALSDTNSDPATWVWTKLAEWLARQD